MTVENRWRVGDPILAPGPVGSFDQVAAKDPSIVFFDGMWHLFYTAASKAAYTTGYVSAQTLGGLQSAPRHQLVMIRGQDGYGCAPQVFYYEPLARWMLIFQTRDANYQPAFSTTATISEPASWSEPQPLIRKDTPAKWIDFWVICDQTKAYLFYTQAHQSVIVRSTDLDRFPRGWNENRQVLDGVHEAVHVYRARGRDEFHMVYELNHGGVRSFGLAISHHLDGPWQKVTDRYAAGYQLEYDGQAGAWTDMVSHGELLRSGYDEQMEYEPHGCRWVIQGLLHEDAHGPYPSLPWKLGIMARVEPGDDQDAPAGAP